MMLMLSKRLKLLVVVMALAAVAAGCAAGKAFRKAEEAMRAGDLDAAVAGYRAAVQASPENASYKIALQHAMLAASRAHLDRAREYEKSDQLEAALGEYKQASEYDPSNRLVAQKVADLERTIRERVEAARPKPAIQQARERARAASQPPPLYNFNTVLARITFNNAPLREIFATISSLSGVSVTFDRQYQDRNFSVTLDGVTLEQALNQILSVNNLSYKVLSDRSILIFENNAQKHLEYDDQVIQTFYLSNADATELVQLLSQAFRPPGIPVQPAIAPNKAQNSITIRGTAPVVAIFEKLIQQNDKPRAEIVVDVEIMEVDRSRTKQYGLNLSQYAIGGLFSPEVSPNGTTTTTTPTTPTTPGVTAPVTGAAAGARSTAPDQLASPPPFNLNTITRGISTADFYLAIPTAVVRFLESDTHTKVLAKPQLRGAEGTKLSFKTGQQIPIVSTTFLPVATGGAGQNPLASYTYKDVGINLDMTPRVSPEGDILLDLVIDDSSQGPSQTVAGTPNVPTFQQRTVTTRLRLRDGESNLLAGLIQDSQSTVVSGVPGLIRVPFLSSALAGNSKQEDQTDVVMLLTPHIIRGPEITETDLRPIYIGSNSTFSLGGQPPLLAPTPDTPAPPAAPAAAPARATPQIGQQTPQGTIAVPAGATPIPGTVVVPNPPPPPPTTTPVQPALPAQPQAATPPPEPQASAQARPAAQEPPITSPGIGAAQVIISPPAGALRVGQGPYNIPLSVTGAQRLSTVTLTVTFDPRVLRVRSVQEGSFLRSGGANVTFTQQVNNGRIDITISRGADATGVSGTGLLAAILFDAIAPGGTTLTASGTATGPGNTPMGLQFRPVPLTVQ
jgi:general secretion pathway protein D